MRHVLFFVGLLAASPVLGQSRVYTNADLRKPMPRTAPLGAVEAAAILAPHQFVYVPVRRVEPGATMSRSSATAGPFGEFRAFSPTRRLDGSPYSDPPWSVTSYRGWRRDVQRAGGIQRFRRAASPSARRTPVE